MADGKFNNTLQPWISPAGHIYPVTVLTAVLFRLAACLHGPRRSFLHSCTAKLAMPRVLLCDTACWSFRV